MNITVTLLFQFKNRFQKSEKNRKYYKRIRKYSLIDFALVLQFTNIFILPAYFLFPGVTIRHAFVIMWPALKVVVAVKKRLYIVGVFKPTKERYCKGMDMA